MCSLHLSGQFAHISFCIFTIDTFSGRNVLDYRNNSEDEALLKMSNDKMLSVKIKNKEPESNSIEYYNVFGKEIHFDRADDKCYIKPHFIISNSDDSLCHIVTKKIIRVPANNEETFINDFEYDWNLNDTILILSRYFRIEKEKIWVLPEMEINLKIFKGKSIVMKGNTTTYFEKLPVKGHSIHDQEINF